MPKTIVKCCCAAVVVVLTALPTRKFYRKMCRRRRRQVSFETHTHTHTHELWQLQRSDCVCVCVCECILCSFLLYAAKFIKSKRSSCRNSKTPPTTTLPTLVPAESLWEWWTPCWLEVVMVVEWYGVCGVGSIATSVAELFVGRLGDTPWTFGLNIALAKNIKEFYCIMMPKLRFNFNLINAVHSVPNCCSSRWIEWKMMIIIAYLFISGKLRVANFAHFPLYMCVCVCKEYFTWFLLVLPTYGGIQQNFPQGISPRLPARIVRVCIRVCMWVCSGRGNCNSSKKLQLPKDVWKCECGGRNRKRVLLPLPAPVSKNKKTWN